MMTWSNPCGHGDDGGTSATKLARASCPARDGPLRIGVADDDAGVMGVVQASGDGERDGALSRASFEDLAVHDEAISALPARRGQRWSGAGERGRRAYDRRIANDWANGKLLRLQLVAKLVTMIEE